MRKRTSKLIGYLALTALTVLVLVGLGWLVALVGTHPALAAMVAAAVVVAAVLLGIVLRLAGRLATRGKTVLEWQLTDVPAEASAGDPLSMVTGSRGPTLATLTQALRDAAEDPSVAALVATIDLGPSRPAAVQELADAVRDFRAAGKLAVAYTDTFDGNWGYYLATAFDQILLGPGGELAVTGFGMEPNYYAKTLAKAGLRVQVGRRFEFKDAMDQLGEPGMRGPSRRAREEMYESLFGQLVGGIAAGRKLAEETVREVIDRAPLLAEETVAAGFVDRLAHRDEAIDLAKARARGKGRLRYLDDYAKKTGKKAKSSPVALVTASGTMMRKRQISPLGGMNPMVAGKVCGVLRKALTDKKVKAVVLRVDSPGGEAVAGVMIAREIERLREAGKPVVVSMGGVAGSGGYWIAAPADRIVAQPTTLTGSIGVVTMKPVMAGLKRRLAVRTEEISTSRHANLHSVNRPFSDSEMERVDAGLDRVYEQFLELVGAGRKMSREQVHEVARGRVWTGADAKQIGLVDELGGLPVALRLAKELAGIPADKKTRLRAYPQTSALSGLRRKKGESSEDPAAAAAAAVATLLGSAVRAGVRGAAAELALTARRGEVHCGFDGYLR